MTVTFGFEYGTSQPDSLQVVKGLFYPWCSNCDYRALLQAVGIIGDFTVCTDKTTSLCALFQVLLLCLTIFICILPWSKLEKLTELEVKKYERQIFTTLSSVVWLFLLV